MPYNFIFTVTTGIQDRDFAANGYRATWHLKLQNNMNNNLQTFVHCKFSRKPQTSSLSALGRKQNVADNYKF